MPVKPDTRPVTLIVLQIQSCQQCPNFGTRNPWSSDGFDRMEDWYCKLTNGTIQGAVEWHEEKKIEVPQWCPIRYENQKA